MTAPTENAVAVARLFRVWSKVYDNPLPQRLFYKRVHRRVLRRWRPRPGERVLDVGCGTGVFLRTLAEKHAGLELTGLDLSEHMLAKGRRDARGGHRRAPRLLQGSVYEMPFPDAAFDVATNTISCHFYLEQVRAFREIHRVLAPGGRFFCAALDVGILRRLPVAGVAVHHPVPVISDHLRQAGFEVTSCERVFPRVALFELRKPEWSEAA